MAFRVRRIVTTRDARGKSVVGTDSRVDSVPSTTVKTIDAADIWWTDSMPADVEGRVPTAQSPPGMPRPSGTMLKILELSPGTKPRMHKTETLDYVIVMEGEVGMLLEDGVEVHMTAGDILIQRATVHGWANKSDGVCRLAVFLVDAKR